MKKLLSIIIPTFNCSTYIENCINSLNLNEFLDEVEVIVIDDGSKDNTEEIVLKMTMKYSNIIYKKIKNSGPSIARNEGINISTGKYIIFVDSDDIVENNYISGILSYIKNADFNLIHYNKLYRKENNRKFVMNENIPLSTKGNFNDYIKYLIGPSKNDSTQYSIFLGKNVFSSKIIKDNNIFFPLKKIYFSEDRIFLLKYLSKCSSNITFINEGYYVYYKRNNSTINRVDDKRFDKLVSSYEELSLVVKELYGDVSTELDERLTNYLLLRFKYLIDTHIDNNASSDVIMADIEKILSYFSKFNENYLSADNKEYLDSLKKHNVKKLKKDRFIQQKIYDLKIIVKGIVRK